MKIDVSIINLSTNMTHFRIVATLGSCLPFHVVL